ncbi:hypothetical protein [Companilactobacillus zhongbaensis]|uniref:hypothetical protein n=1 Tax=Companilactobacillus zhongbaensis TaxID=2486009 RepID=UPI000F768C70|nr:hypothetical protein [Companilactobacillus zhongbaensis]
MFNQKSGNSIAGTFPSHVENDGNISTKSGQCGQLVYNHYVNVIEGANHGTINTIPEVTKIVNEWQV